MNNDDISHFLTIPASFAIISNVYFLTHQYLIINTSQSQRALSVSVRTVLWIYFASRRNCGLLPTYIERYLTPWNKYLKMTPRCLRINPHVNLFHAFTMSTARSPIRSTPHIMLKTIKIWDMSTHCSLGKTCPIIIIIVTQTIVSTLS